MKTRGLLIDPATGSVTLPGGWIIRPELTQQQLKASPQAAGITSHDRGTLPFIHYHLIVGTTADDQLSVGFCFYDQELLYLDMTVLLDPSASREWSNYSLDVEADTKRCHEALLTQLLGPPMSCTQLSVYGFPQNQQVLANSCSWNYGWGRVTSYHDPRGGSTAMKVEYEGRLDKAHADYERNNSWKRRMPGAQ